jgi:hypothetical protein
MIKALTNKLLGKIQLYSHNLSNVNSICNRTWVTSDLFGNYCTYRFQQNSELLVGINGTGQIWKYKFLPPNSLVLDYNNHITILNHGYIFNGLMVLEKEGTNEKVLFYDNKIVSDGNVEEYIRNEMIKILNLRPFTHEQSTILLPNGEVYNFVGKTIYDNEFVPFNKGKLFISSFGFEIDQEHIIRKVFVPVVFATNMGDIVVQTENRLIQEGLKTYFKDNDLIPHGRFRIEENKKIKSLIIIGGIIKTIHHHEIHLNEVVNKITKSISSWFKRNLYNLLSITVFIIVGLIMFMLRNYFSSND